MKLTLLCIFPALAVSCNMKARAQTASEYTVTDITGWTPSQMAALPYFDRYVTVAPDGAGADFVPSTQNGTGMVAGNRNFYNTWVQGSGAFVSNGSMTSVASWGQYSWSWTYWDGTDSHFSNGFVQHSPVSDVSLSGLVIGHANLAGSGSGASASSSYIDHGFIHDPATGSKTDITPDATRAMPRCINDHDVIVGTWSSGTANHAFKRLPDGTLQELSGAGATVIYPSIINNRGLVAGSYRGATYTRPFACSSSLTILDLGLPDQGSPDTGDVVDVNDHGVVVGSVHKAVAWTEPYAVRWYHDGNAWVAEDLNEVNATGGFVIDSCVAVNDAGHIIARGHLDGSDVFSSRTFLLSPDAFPPPSAITLSAAGISPTAATLRAKINACTASTTVTFQAGASTAYGQTVTATPAMVTGTAPAVCTVLLTGLTPHTTYHFRSRAENASGTTNGDDLAFTTPHDLNSWTLEKFGTQAGNPAVSGPEIDHDGDGETNFAEYAFGHDPTTPDAKGTPPTLENNAFCITYTRPNDHSGLQYAVEVASSLTGPWSSGPGFTETISTTLSGTAATVKTRSLLPPALDKRQFMRVRVTQSP
ncbi:MAG: hypothetical protein CJBNEKGG_01713 [Prosthecobacter sp.]|nr:hypothetical protein [Prosthecobacter sp.]